MRAKDAEDQRNAFMLLLMARNPEDGWISLKNSQGAYPPHNAMCAGFLTPDGPISFEIPEDYWNGCEALGVKELMQAPCPLTDHMNAMMLMGQWATILRGARICRECDNPLAPDASTFYCSEECAQLGQHGTGLPADQSKHGPGCG